MLHIAIAAGLVLGLGTGLLAAATGNSFLMALATGAAPLGAVFMNAIRMVVIPLVMAVIFTGVAKLGDPRKLGRLGGMTLAFFWITVIPAIPSNPFAAASAGSLLPLIVFTALLAAATGTLPAERRDRLVAFADDIGEALIKLVWWILWTAPIGVFGLAAPVTAQLGWGLVQNLAIFVVSVMLGLAVFLGVVYLPLLYLIAGVTPARFFGGTFGAASIAFSTTSTVAALPVTLEEAKTKLGVSSGVADLVLPLGASMYRAGSALFQGAAIIFLAHLFEVPIPPTAVGGAILATFLVSLTVAPVPSSGVVTLAPALDAVGIPMSGLAILLGIDRIPDMFRSATNLLGQITTAVLVDRWTAD